LPEADILDEIDWISVFGHTPKIIRQLSRGQTNQVWLIESQGSRFALRVGSHQRESMGINRSQEHVIMQAASAAGLAPSILYMSAEPDILITEYIDGEHCGQAQVESESFRNRLFDILHQIHSIKIDLPTFNYESHLSHYWHELDRLEVKVDDALLAEKDTMLVLASEAPQYQSICHHDLIPDNLIFTSDNIIVIDWEYAAYGWPAFDFATLSVEWGIEIEKLTLPAQITQQDIINARALYVHLCLLWRLLNQ
jgi:thiamine kinase